MSHKRAWEIGSACVLAALLLVCAWAYYAGVELPRQLNERFALAVEQGDLDEIQAFARKGAKLNNHAGSTALVIAAWQGETDIVLELIQLGASSRYVERTTGQGTPLQLASHYGHADTVKALARAIPHSKAELNEALAEVAWSRSIETAKALIHAGADWGAGSVDEVLPRIRGTGEWEDYLATNRGTRGKTLGSR